ncbi:AMP-dependent synthetase/ligase [Vallitalea guaymasensis]|uniref:AMP-binding protein n=1 Tax=Vallitalea guaymasensis TaxID=1185412 RepID=A0A8J8MBH5_9FIRM|nr:AMP-binding protein [Vallitalea guaymasensis]QUH29847.1 AMP-binding protein [Vallitalea guaymasensis]
MKKSYKNPFYEYGEKLSSVKELMIFSAKKHGEKTVFKYKLRNKIISKTYNELLRDVKEKAQFLVSLDLPKQHIAIIGKTSYDWIVSYLSVLYAGMVAVPIDILLSTEEYLELLERADVDIVFCDKKYLSDIEKSDSKGLKKIICINDSQVLENESTLSKKYDISLDDAVDKNKIDAEALALIVFTSGTTGKSKGVMLSQKNIIVDVMSAKRILGLDERDTSLSILPLYHTYEMTCDILLMMYYGASVCLNDSLKYMSQNLKLFKPSVLYAVPMVVESIHRTIMESAKKKNKEKILKKMLKLSTALQKVGINLSRKIFKSVLDEFGGELKLIVSGGAYLDQSYIDFFDAIGVNIVQGYGITECSPLLSANPDRFKKKYSIGCVVSCCQVKINEDERYEKVNGHLVGEILAKGDNVMLGYYKDTENTNKAFEGEWFKTGDIGWMDEDNYLYITGRVKNLIILSNGKNVSPEEIEGKLSLLPVIKEVQVVSKKENNTEQIQAIIFPDELFIKENNIVDVQKYIEDQVNDVNRSLPVYMQVGSVKLRDTEFPKTSTKKIKRL